MQRLHADAALYRRAGPVFNLTAPLSRFLEPSFVADVLLSAARARLEARSRRSPGVPDAPPVPA